ncbi:hypothetical protein BJ085DRAFT_32072 [Dimargaris cristalligena]|uniref:Uncharacterized protein n=1 Tax=Dimargaris cristalligena TaxID=215637 RepID=A0A4P9ZLS3_9FUNG|nr:hypothetical protein BJ085DRAFT_32072 [Dimargaris cristalligena]|eukprot:RKP34103.1 hypothetical protein BJ085DRAFT_32072 [Dimargaris cristalligena]
MGAGAEGSRAAGFYGGLFLSNTAFTGYRYGIPRKSWVHRFPSGYFRDKFPHELGYKAYLARHGVRNPYSNRSTLLPADHETLIQDRDYGSCSIGTAVYGKQKWNVII